MRKSWPDRSTVEGRALAHLRVCHKLYREPGGWVDSGTQRQWRAEARMLAEVISGRTYPLRWREVEATIRLIEEREASLAAPPVLPVGVVGPRLQ